MSEQLTKNQILKYSGCTMRAIVSFVFMVIGAVIATLMLYYFRDTNQPLMVAVGVVGALLFFISLTLMCKELPLITKIIKGQYEIKACQLLSIRFRRPYCAGDDSDKALEFSKFRLTVDKYTAEQFRVGDTIVMVFANKIKYPIVIRKDVSNSGK